MLKAMFGDQQMETLADIIQTALMLRIKQAPRWLSGRVDGGPTVDAMDAQWTSCRKDTTDEPDPIADVRQDRVSECVSLCLGCRVCSQEV